MTGKSNINFINSLENNCVGKFILELEIFCELFRNRISSQAHWKINQQETKVKSLVGSLKGLKLGVESPWKVEKDSRIKTNQEKKNCWR